MAKKGLSVVRGSSLSEADIVRQYCEELRRVPFERWHREAPGDNFSLDLGNHNYIVQSNYDNGIGGCRLVVAEKGGNFSWFEGSYFKEDGVYDLWRSLKDQAKKLDRKSA